MKATLDWVIKNEGEELTGQRDKGHPLQSKEGCQYKNLRSERTWQVLGLAVSLGGEMVTDMPGGPGDQVHEGPKPALEPANSMGQGA